MAFVDQKQTIVVDGAFIKRNPFGKATYALAKRHLIGRADGLAAFNLLGIAPARLAVPACDASRMSTWKQPRTLQCKGHEKGLGFASVVGYAAQRTQHQELHFRIINRTQKSFFFRHLYAQTQPTVRPF